MTSLTYLSLRTEPNRRRIHPAMDGYNKHHSPGIPFRKSDTTAASTTIQNDQLGTPTGDRPPPRMEP